MKRLFLLAALAPLTACSDDPVNVEGTYTVSVTNKDNGCNFTNWTVGDSATNIQVLIDQNGSMATADVMGGARVFLDLVNGDHVFKGDVDGNDLSLAIVGTRSTTMGNCTLTVDSEMAATLDGDVLTGHINYRYHGNGNTDCAAVQGCVSVQDMNGTRPPS